MSELCRVAPWEDRHRQSTLLPSTLGSRCLRSERRHPLRQAVAAERVILVPLRIAPEQSSPRCSCQGQLLAEAKARHRASQSLKSRSNVEERELTRARALYVPGGVSGTPAGLRIAHCLGPESRRFPPHSYFGNRNSDVWVEEDKPRAWRQAGRGAGRRLRAEAAPSGLLRTQAPSRGPGGCRLKEPPLSTLRVSKNQTQGGEA
ncbi:unnamed protein product [Rangifer tarandus platyrhynchus]|uniref:Uncharacterized protein n=2 Tax=Rangifer tarandus platyrhynchus TaxID=3082113 RepID=A0ABN8YEE1_RANTA|nr:unnamed protein product [Rangifer tarandus platyrhynchus]CAI9699749.1 unnamed protein product [Rangifer tarandus platyrhynchus]